MSKQTPGECPQCERLQREVDRLKQESDRLKQQVETLSAALEETRRAGKRQAAPFRKKPAQPNPQKPGRKPGADYGEHRRRDVPEAIDETYDVPLPKQCPACGGTQLTETAIHTQYQIEIPRRPISRQFDVHRGRCEDCHGAVQGRHALQTSDALGAAGVQLGPNAQAAMVLLNKDAGLSHGKVARLFETLFGIRIARSTSARSLRRTAGRLEPAHAEIREAVRTAPWIVPDETGWRIGGQSAWLHAFVAEDATCYVVHPRRSADPLADVIGWGYGGILIHDGWSPYERFPNARHQQCLRHLLNRCQELLEAATGTGVWFPRDVQDVLGRALDVRDRWWAGEISDHGRDILQGRLRAELERLVALPQRHRVNETFAAFLERHIDDVFRFLIDPDIDATNYRAEQAIRPAVVNRKVWGGNRTPAGARDQSILMSVLRTCHQRALDALEFLSRTLRAPSAELLPNLGR